MMAGVRPLARSRPGRTRELSAPIVRATPAASAGEEDGRAVREDRDGGLVEPACDDGGGAGQEERADRADDGVGDGADLVQ